MVVMVEAMIMVVEMMVAVMVAAEVVVDARWKMLVDYCIMFN